MLAHSPNRAAQAASPAPRCEATSRGETALHASPADAERLVWIHEPLP